MSYYAVVSGKDEGSDHFVLNWAEDEESAQKWVEDESERYKRAYGHRPKKRVTTEPKAKRAYPASAGQGYTFWRDDGNLFKQKAPSKTDLVLERLADRESD